MSSSEAPLVNVYDEEYKRIQQVGWEAQQIWNEIARHVNIADVKETARKMNEFARRVEGMYYDAGFIVAVDVTPIYADQPPSISVLDRVNPEEFDHEKKAAEVRRSMS